MSFDLWYLSLQRNSFPLRNGYFQRRFVPLEMVTFRDWIFILAVVGTVAQNILENSVLRLPSEAVAYFLYPQ